MSQIKRVKDALAKQIAIGGMAYDIASKISCNLKEHGLIEPENEEEIYANIYAGIEFLLQGLNFTIK